MDVNNLQQTCFRRLKKEASTLEKEVDDYVKLEVDPDNIRKWKAILLGPPGSYYENYEFMLRIDIPDNYPLVSPKMTFITKIFHPNVHFDTGEICLDILKKQWSPAWTIVSACRAVVALLAEPAPDSPLNCDAGNMLRAGDTIAFKSMSFLYCEEFARLKSKAK